MLVFAQAMLGVRSEIAVNNELCRTAYRFGPLVERSLQGLNAVASVTEAKDAITATLLAIYLRR